MFILAILLVFLAGTLLSLAISTFYTGISPTPSSLKNRKTIVAAIDQCLQQHHSGTQIQLIDAGSGFGGLCFYLHKETGLTTMGMEYGFYPWSISRIRQMFFKENHSLIFLKTDFRKQVFAEDSILVAYLFVAGIEELYQQIMQQPKKPIALISLAFSVKAVEADQVLYSQDMYKTPVYIYFFKDKSS